MTLFPTPVLVATDGTARSRAALLAAVEICRATNSPLHLVHAKVTASPLRGRPMTPTQRRTTEDEGAALLEREAGAAAEAGYEVAGTHLRHGERTDRVLAAVQDELHAGLLVVGAGSRSGSLVDRVLTPAGGSTVRQAPGSVLVVRS
ncbi:universal stress protein [Egicoccus sp. AB-alg6-2]|uniref:universal stress protein n=1 Tax=Egicoccus sp. AB-alg6-2 TaxID=3242692 RepID=UPI00359D788A